MRDLSGFMGIFMALGLGLLPLSQSEAQPPQPMQGQLPRATLAARMRFSSDPDGNTRGYCAGLSMHDASGNAAEIGVQSDWNDAPSSGVPKVHSNMNYVSADLGRGLGFKYEYGQFIFKQNTWYQVELRYLDDQQKAQFLVDGAPVYEVPAKMLGRLYFAVLICGADNGDVIKADFQNVTVGGFNPQGNGLSNDVIPYADWNTKDYNYWGLSIKQTNYDDVRHRIQGANFHAEGTMTGMPQGLDWDTVEGATGKGPQATALNAEYWFGQ
jgi:hypothetical protein